jgi:hypothetical protein
MMLQSFKEEKYMKKLYETPECDLKHISLNNVLTSSIDEIPASSGTYIEPGEGDVDDGW